MSAHKLVVASNRKKTTAEEVLDGVKGDGCADIQQILVITLRDGRACWNYNGSMSTSDMVYLLERVKHAILNK